MAPHVQRHRSGLLGTIIAIISWLHSLTVKPLVNFYNNAVLGSLEESIRSLIRESLALTQRTLNGISASVLSVFNRGYKQQLRGRWQELADLHSWWREDKKHSTLNAVLARKYGESAEGGRQADGPAAADLPHSKVSSSSGLGHRAPRGQQLQPGTAGTGGSSQSSSRVATPAISRQASDAAIAAGTAGAPLAGGQETGAAAAVTVGEIEPASDDEQQQQQQRQLAGGLDADEQESTQWWQQGAGLLPSSAPAWLAAMSEEAQEAAAAAQEAASAATAAVQQAASSVSTAAQQAVEEAAAAAAALARNMRAVFEQQPAGWSVDEAIRGRTGLLEDVSLFSQLLVTRIFDAIRWLIGCITLTPTTPTAARAAAIRPQSSGLSHAAASGSASPRTSIHGSGFGGSRRLNTAAGGSHGAVPTTIAGAVTSGSGSGGFFGMAGRLLCWPFSKGSTTAQLAAGAATAGASKWAAAGGERQRGGGGACSPTVFKRRSATSVDLPSATRMWMSDSEDEASEDENSGSGDHTDDLSEHSAASADTGSCQAATAVPAASIARSPSPTKHPLKPSLSISSTSRTGGLTGGQAGKLGYERNRAAEVVTGVSLNRVAFAGAERVDQSSDGGRAGAADAAELQPCVPALVSPAKTPFASSRVQEKHHSVISRDEWAKQHRVQQPALPHGRSPNQLQQNVQDKQRRKQRRRGWTEDQRQASWDSGGRSSIGSTGSGNRPLQRSHSGPAISELKDVSSAGQVIRMAGYPLEVHEVQTTDGYLLRMERIPQHSSTDVVFMMHGVLDTSLTWVAGGITGSQAFAAWDRGFDVWLGTSRSNPPHTAVDPKLQGSAYWRYTNNEVGMYDMGAQIDHIHTTKMRELAALGVATGHRTARVSMSSIPSTPRGGATAAPYSGSSSASRRSAAAPAPVAAESPAGAVLSETSAQLPGLSSIRQETAASYSRANAVHAESAPKAGAACDSSTVAQDAAATHQDLQFSQLGDAADGFATPLSSGYTTPTGDAPLCTSGIKPIATSERSSSGRASLRLGRAESAAEADAAAAAEAAIALSRYRAAAAAAGVAQPAESAGSERARAGVSTAALAERFWWGARSVQRKSSRDVLLGRRAGSLDLDSAAATTTAAAASAAAAAISGGARVAAAAGTVSAAAAVAAAAAALSHTSDGARSQQQREQEEQHAAESPCSSQGSAPCTVHIIRSRHGDTADQEGQLHTESLHAKSSSAAGAAAAGAAGAEQVPATANSLAQSVWRRLGSSSSMRHVSSAPDMAAFSAAGADTTSAPIVSSSSSSRNDQPVADSPEGNDGYASAGSSSSHSGARSGYASAASSSAASSAASSGRSTQDDVSAGQLSRQDAAVQQQQLWKPQPEATELTGPSSSRRRSSSSSGRGGGSHTSPGSQQSLPTAQSTARQIMAEVQQRQSDEQQQVMQSHNHHQQQQQQTALLSPHASRPLSSAGSGQLAEPYNLRVVGHSLGGFLVLIYCIQRQREGRPHHVRRLILLSPAGFHPVIPAMFKPVVYVWRPLMWYMTWIWRQQAFPVHLPTFVARMLAFKLTLDTSKLPAVGDLMRSFARLVLGGDRSAWDRAMLMPHYTAAGMPLLSSFQVMHFIQLYVTKRCQLYDYGSTATNVAAYQQATPPSISDCYHALRSVPVHLVAGLHDGVIPPVNIQRHFEAMQAAGVDVTYREFDYGHMDFTFSAKEELGYYVSGLLMRK